MSEYLLRVETPMILQIDVSMSMHRAEIPPMVYEAIAMVGGLETPTVHDIAMAEIACGSPTYLSWCPIAGRFQRTKQVGLRHNLT